MKEYATTAVDSKISTRCALVLSGIISATISAVRIFEISNRIEQLLQYSI